MMGHWIQRRHAGSLRIGVVYVSLQAFAAEDDHEAMLFYRLNEHFDARHLHRPQPDRNCLALLARNATGAAIGDFAGRVKRAEISASCHVVRPQLEADARRLQCPAANQILERIVAKQPQMPRPAPRTDPRLDRNA